MTSNLTSSNSRVTVARPPLLPHTHTLTLPPPPPPPAVVVRLRPPPSVVFCPHFLLAALHTPPPPVGRSCLRQGFATSSLPGRELTPPPTFWCSSSPSPCPVWRLASSTPFSGSSPTSLLRWTRFDFRPLPSVVVHPPIPFVGVVF